MVNGKSPGLANARHVALAHADESPCFGGCLAKEFTIAPRQPRRSGRRPARGVGHNDPAAGCTRGPVITTVISGAVRASR
jgi:hypothetical protein